MSARCPRAVHSPAAPKALACRTGCDGCVALTVTGKLDASKLCSACLFELPIAKVDAKLAADEATKQQLPYFVDAGRGTTLGTIITAICSVVRFIGGGTDSH
mmetsp:Transcript_16547/g.37047  ORF Transcript_16547/g.37047 Transcript_16547/m.37047 type:complete len:102 (+) Transcript_16547:381-686(+)